MSYQLTPADIADLRASLHSRPHDATGDSLGFPFIVWGQAGREWYLHAYGRTMATSKRIEPLAACLIAERAEPGFIARVLDVSWTVEEALLDADARREARVRQMAARAAETLAATDRENAREAARRVRPEHLTHLTLDSLLKS